MNDKAEGWTFSKALQLIRAGGRVRRVGWCGNHQIFLCHPVGIEVSNAPYIVIHTQQGQIIPWLASQADLLADDWRVA